MKYLFSFAFIGVALLLGACASTEAAESAQPKKDIAVQLYSVRDLVGNPERFAENQDSVLNSLAQMGYTAVETAFYGDGKFYGVSPEEFKAAVEKAGLKVLSSHASRGLSGEEVATGDFTEVMKWWDECIAAHKAAGMEYIVTPAQPRPSTLKELKVWCDYHNAIGKKCAEAGLKYGYHNHAYEFERVEDQVMYDYMIENTDPQYVHFQMDVYWAVVGNASPVAYFKKYPGRFATLHIKDDKEIGQSGMVGFDAIFKNAEVAGLENIIVEVEAINAPTLLEAMQQSADYLLNADFVKESYCK
ncbi:MAG: TIM barrel protein [Muribaculaceae bacterium]|nr:TIM barrel protein [Muribaculaceae bacterium]